MTRRFLLRSTGLLLLLALLFTSETTYAQRDNSEPRASPNAAVSQTIGTTVVDMHFSRPGVKGRTIFGDLVPYGEVWRAGANEPTTITFSDDVQVEGETLEAGTYNLFIRPNENGPWDVIFTTPVDWGTMYNQADAVLEVSASPVDAPMQEWMTYRFVDLGDGSATLLMHWAETGLPINIATAG
jgi:hypothetical protein